MNSVLEIRIREAWKTTNGGPPGFPLLSGTNTNHVWWFQTIKESHVGYSPKLESRKHVNQHPRTFKKPVYPGMSIRPAGG